MCSQDDVHFTPRAKGRREHETAKHSQLSWWYNAPLNIDPQSSDTYTLPAQKEISALAVQQK